MRGDSSQGLSSPAIIHHSPSPTLYLSRKREFPDILETSAKLSGLPRPPLKCLQRILGCQDVPYSMGSSTGHKWNARQHPPSRMMPLMSEEMQGYRRGKAHLQNPPWGRAGTALWLWPKGFPESVQGGEGWDVHQVLPILSLPYLDGDDAGQRLPCVCSTLDGDPQGRCALGHSD